jgi:hypothetical protein
MSLLDKLLRSEMISVSFIPPNFCLRVLELEGLWVYMVRYVLSLVFCYCSRLTPDFRFLDFVLGLVGYGLKAEVLDLDSARSIPYIAIQHAIMISTALRCSVTEHRAHQHSVSSEPRVLDSYVSVS